MKTVITAIAFVAIATISAYAYPPVTEPAGDENAAAVANDEGADAAHLTDPCASRSVWCMEEAAFEESGYDAEDDEGESSTSISLQYDKENPDEHMVI